MTFNDVAATTDSVTFFARIRPGARVVTTTSWYCIYNNIFSWKTTTTAFGHFFGLKYASGAYQPFFYVGQKDMTFANLSLAIDKWYDYAISVTLEGDQYKILCVVCGEEGTTYQTTYIPFARTEGDISGTTDSCFGGQGTFTTWQTSNGQYQSKNYNGLIHEFAVWERGLTFDEILDAFGRPAEKNAEDPYADADYWWKFDKDIDGNGTATADEIRGVRTWGTDAAPAAGNPVLSRITTENAPKWRQRAVLKPARGETVSSDCLAFEPEWQVLESGEKQVRPAQMNFKAAAMAGSMTVLARVRLTQDFTDATEQFLYNNAHKYATNRDQGGRMFGFFKSGNVQTFVPRIFAGQRYASANIPMKTNTWYDIAYTYAPGTDAQGVDAISVVVADDEHGVRTWSGTILTNQFLQVERNVRIGGQSESDTWVTWQNAAGSDTAGGAWRKMFCGDLHELAVWNRALSTDEILLAMGWPRALFGAGTADGTAGEFAPAGSGSYDTAAGAPWHDIAGTLDSSHRSLAVRFTPPLNWHGMPQAFRLRPAMVGDGTESARVALSVNGKSLGEGEVSTGEDAWWWIGASQIAAGENSLTLTLRSGDPAVAIDRMDISGSWAAVSVSGDAFPQENDTTSKDFYVGDRRMAHITRAVTGNAAHTKNRLHFWMPPELAARYEFRLSFDVFNCGTGSAFNMNLNGVSQGSWTSNDYKGKTIELVFAPGTLEGGWNVIEPERTAGWTQFSFYRLKMHNANAPFILTVR